jgi:hypothetical protein
MRYYDFLYFCIAKEVQREMKYYLIAGEASGDLHASHLMAAILQEDEQAQFRFYGGDMMTAVGGTCVQHYREMAYMGFIEVIAHLRPILNNMRKCKKDILQWNPDVLILIDYPSFNLKMAKFVKERLNIPVFYYISPKLWAWKEYRIKDIRRYVDMVYSILPFEVDFYRRHNYHINYVGNPLKASSIGYINVSAFERAAEEMEAVAMQARRAYSKKICHIVISFSDVELSRHHRNTIDGIAMQCMNYFSGRYQCVFVTHELPNKHIHLIINRVSYVDFKRYRDRYEDRQDFWVFLQRLLRGYGIPLWGF